jgi:uncharacterized protein
MHLIVDGYNLLHVGRSALALTPSDLQRERDHLIDQLSSFRRIKPYDVTVVFDGWQGGWVTERRERIKGVDVIFSKLGEKADEVIKRLVKEKGAGAIVITSDREIARYAEKMDVAVVSSDQFKDRVEMAAVRTEKGGEEAEAGRGGGKRKGPSRRLSKKQRRARAALKKL